MSIPTKVIIPEITDIVNFYEPDLVEKIARETGFVQRESELGGIEFLGIMTAGLYGRPDASLSQMAAMAKTINPESEISKPGLHQRKNKSGVQFLKKMLSKALELSTSRSLSRSLDGSIPALLNSFPKVYLLDSTYVSLPEKLSSRWRGSGGDGSPAGIKFQLVLEYKSGKYNEIVTTEGISPDQNYTEESIKLMNSGDLIIYDLGYFNMTWDTSRSNSCRSYQDKEVILLVGTIIEQICMQKRMKSLLSLTC